MRLRLPVSNINESNAGNTAVHAINARHRTSHSTALTIVALLFVACSTALWVLGLTDDPSSHVRSGKWVRRSSPSLPTSDHRTSHLPPAAPDTITVKPVGTADHPSLRAGGHVTHMSSRFSTALPHLYAERNTRFPLGVNCTPIDPAGDEGTQTTVISCLWYPSPTNRGAQCCCTVIDLTTMGTEVRGADEGPLRGAAASARPRPSVTPRVLPYFACLPSLLIAGAQKAGTTALFAHLLPHRALLPPVHHKELHFFDRYTLLQSGAPARGRSPAQTTRSPFPQQEPEQVSQQLPVKGQPPANHIPRRRGRDSRGLAWYIRRFASWEAALLQKNDTAEARLSTTADPADELLQLDVGDTAAPLWAISHAAKALADLKEAAQRLIKASTDPSNPMLDPLAPSRVKGVNWARRIALSWVNFAAQHATFEATPSYILDAASGRE